jgi:carbon-monoxide dehydrogenase small subunit
VLAAEADGTRIATVEGLAAPGGELSALQQAFLDTGAAQCGFCIPGQLMAGSALLATDPQPTRAAVEEGLAGNLCRCAGYEQIIEAVLLAAERQAHDDEVPGSTRDGPGPIDPADVRPDPDAVPDARVAPQ